MERGVPKRSCAMFFFFNFDELKLKLTLACLCEFFKSGKHFEGHHLKVL